jgi:hypothetical protein
MIDFAYEDLETEAVQEREENEKYEAECAREDEQLKLTHPYLNSLTPTPTKAQGVKETAEFILKCMQTDGVSTGSDRALCRLIIRLADAIDER